jgi:hypothetical protein
MLEHCDWLENAGRLSWPRDELEADHRIAAQIEEVVLHASCGTPRICCQMRAITRRVRARRTRIIVRQSRNSVVAIRRRGGVSASTPTTA